MKKRSIISLFLSFFLISFCLASPWNLTLASEGEGESVTSLKNQYLDYNETRSTRYISIHVMLASSYRNTFSSPYFEASNRMSTVGVPFISTWGIGFTPTFTAVNNFPIDSCTLSLTSYCNNTSCDSGCTNATSTNIHHKNAYKNFSVAKSSTPLSGYSLVLTLVTASMCGIYNGSHVNGILGLGEVSGYYALVSNTLNDSITLRVRIMQHEISHLFGCQDGVCTANTPCIMNGGYDNTAYNVSNIWCPSCQTYFNPNTH